MADPARHSTLKAMHTAWIRSKRTKFFHAVHKRRVAAGPIGGPPGWVDVLAARSRHWNPAGCRFAPTAVPAIYLGSSRDTVRAEVWNRPLPKAFGSHARATPDYWVFQVHATSHSCVLAIDLIVGRLHREARFISRFGCTASECLSPGDYSPSQSVTAGLPPTIDGVRWPSVRHAPGRCIAAFGAGRRFGAGTLLGDL